MPDTHSLALFPLQTVLMPGSTLGLRIFEPRYLDLVRDCGRNGDGFGICLVLEGNETGAPAVPVAFGTEARIEDFGTSDDGLLTLRVRGTRRFRVLRTRVRDNGLLVGDVEWRADDAVLPVQPQHALLATLLQRIVDKTGTSELGIDEECYDDTAWVGWRLAEILPLSDHQRQALLQEDDPLQRMEQLLGLIGSDAI
ncbi:LON peptidase substrate-binding domain-containing protein [Luteimonas vadosa]|uniref:LON peptidase substrate-binding domain-containing protein n=1 Tax=Luteimonas vadosa TaxID=1165507 RepID=A0ABP9DUQ7_9GAMM